jgi:nitrogen fixation NifU-like protein
MNLNELYQELILDHHKHPRNFKHVSECTHYARGDNPLCGDKLTIELVCDESGRVRDIGFHGVGCAISRASASLMTEVVKGKTRAEVLALFDLFHRMATSPMDATTIDTSHLGKLEAFSGVREFPMRVKCATLAWHTLCAAITDGNRIVTTE